MQKQYFSQFVTGVLLTSFIAIPALAAQGGFSAEKEPVVTEHMYAGHKVQQENSQSRIQIVSSRGSRDFPSKNDKVLWRPRRLWPPEGYYFFRDPYLGSV
ncbi:hypothetical protein [Citrobacter farmeri]|uniref:hypothetical protein n=1 Tax=Citrobacter farmeri TaxID=67824 RepID=UPI0036176809